MGCTGSDFSPLRHCITIKEMAIRKRHKLLVFFALVGCIAAWLVHPVYVPLSDAEVREFKPVPIEKRVDRDVFFFETFQRRQGRWCQCKSWISQQFFF